MTTHESNNRIPEIRTRLYAWKRNMNTYWKDLELSMMSINPSIMPLCIRQTTRVQNLCKKVNFQKLVNTFLWIVYSKIMVLRNVPNLPIARHTWKKLCKFTNSLDHPLYLKVLMKQLDRFVFMPDYKHCDHFQLDSNVWKIPKLSKNFIREDECPLKDGINWQLLVCIKLRK